MKRAASDLEDMSDATDEYGAKLAAAGRAFAPTRTGRLRVSITARGSQVIAAATYAGYVEYGTRRMRARRFMARAVEATDRDVDDIYTRSAEKICDQIEGA